MCKEYPIGSIFLWKAPAEYNHLLREIDFLNQPDVEQGRSYELLLDGQQRLTSLFCVVNGLTVEEEDYSSIVLDLHAEPDAKSLFSRRVVKTGDDRYITVKDLMGQTQPAHVRFLPDELYTKFERYRTILLNYPCSLVTISGMQLDDAIEIFERINRQGRRLDRFDLITASVYTKDFDLRERSNNEILKPMKQEFGEIGPGAIPQMLALHTRGATDTVSQLKLTSDDIKPVWKSSVEAFHAALKLLRTHFGVVSESFLPYDAILPVLSYYFYKIKSATVRPQHLPQLERWFWSTSFGERYAGVSQSTMTRDAQWIDKLISDGASFGESLTISLDQLMDSRMTNAETAVRNAFLCLLRLHKPLSFESGIEQEFQSKDYLGFKPTDANRLFKADLMKANQRAVNQLPNFVFMSQQAADKLHQVGMKPSIYFEQVRSGMPQQDRFERIMASHLLPTDDESGIWIDDYERFAQQRASLILARIYQLAGATQTITEEDPVVNHIEVALRDEIHRVLSSKHGADYWHVIPEQASKDIEKQIKADANKSMTNGRITDLRQKLDFCNPRDYWPIIEANAECFDKKLVDKAEQNLKDFQDFRNTTKHNRRADTYLSTRGLAACIYLSRALNLDLSKYGVF
jgi:hypothetical protein